jgi:hypothetical protein
MSLQCKKRKPEESGRPFGFWVGSIKVHHTSTLRRECDLYNHRLPIFLRQRKGRTGRQRCAAALVVHHPAKRSRAEYPLVHRPRFFAGAILYGVEPATPTFDVLPRPRAVLPLHDAPRARGCALRAQLDPAAG